MELFDLTQELINIESVTGHEKDCAEFVGIYLAARKFQVELQPVAGDRANVFAFRGRPEVVLSTHLDTVPPFFPARADAEFIYGRGACDAKGIMASQIVAAERLVGAGVEDVALLFLVGEEGASDGAREANLHPPGSRYIINGEPTDNQLAIGTKGMLWVDIRAKGKMAHSAYPHLGESAVEKLLDVVADLRKLPLPQDPLLGASTLNVGVIWGGRAANVIPDEAEARVVIRTVEDSAPLRRELARLCEGRCDFTIVRDTPVLRLEKRDGFETSVVAFSTDLPSLTHWGRPFLLGPGSILAAHTDHECVRKADLLRAVDLYCRLVCELKGRTDSCGQKD